MSSILLENIHTLATFDEQRRRIQDAWILVRDNKIEAIGSMGSQSTDVDKPAEVDQRIDLTGHVVMPGMINTHHHLFQCLLRNVPALQDSNLFRWLKVLFLIMSEVRDEDHYSATLVNHAELLLSGCTTNVDHSYLKVNDMQFDTQIRAAQEMGMRFHLARGSFSIGESKGGLPPDNVVEDEDDILADTERLIQTYHDGNPMAMVRVDNAPCSPFTVSSQLMKESIIMARRYGVGNHTHFAESPDDHAYMLEVYGKRSVEAAEEWGWVGPDVWYAHGVVLNDEEIATMARTGTAVAHCPNSNMYTAAGCCRVRDLLEAGATVGLGVDGSAANNSSNMLDEVRSMMLLQRVFHCADALSPTQALEIATLGGAKLLRRDDIGVLAPGKAADIIGVDLRRISYAGGMHDPVAALVLCASGKVDINMVNGRLVVSRGELVGVDMPSLIDHHNELAAALVQRTEKRYGISVSDPVWRKAYPYDPRTE
jgi:8-oxoguanine deaminase